MKISEDFKDKITKHVINGIPLERMNMREDQRVRMEIAYWTYKQWLLNKQIRPYDLCRQAALVVYNQKFADAQKGDQKAIVACAQLGITGFNKDRSYAMLKNDVETFEYLVEQLTVPTANIEKAKVVDASDWLIQHGMRQGNDRAVNNGAQLKMRLYNDFDENERGHENLADTDVNITADISVIKPDRVNYSDEEKRKLAKKYNVPLSEIESMMMNSDGIYESAPIEEEEEPDLFLNE